MAQKMDRLARPIGGIKKEDTLDSEKRTACKAVRDLWVGKPESTVRDMCRRIEEAPSSNRIKVLLQEVRDKL